MACGKLVGMFISSFCSLSPVVLMMVKVDMATLAIVVSFLPSSILDVTKSVQHR